ncbi:MAG TPA: 2-C-methyl-D-erythritol 4-phosphate cytidylyltransferase [Methylomirabilota bacterium]|nr:2-C-methyl-D-erythritol 4-phosphate cytidylyltransferase [Methylomirabilota bacterium]
MTYAIVPAGGVGSRMGSPRPKQYLRLGRAPILVATLRALARTPGLAGIVVAVPEAHVAATRRLLARQRVPKILDVVAGGADRQESVWRALQRVPERARWVVVHDGVRPFIAGGLVARVRTAAAGGAATCGMPVRETVKRVRAGAVEATIDRDGLWTTQTPQVFTRALLWEAHEKARRDGFAGTDDAMLVERLGTTVAMVPGLEQNLKITTREDLRTARGWARPRRRA